MMIQLAWRNLWRRPVRTALSLSSMALASALLVFMLSFQLGVYDTMKVNTLKLFDGFAQIQPSGYADDPDIRKTISSPIALADQAMSLPGVNAASPRVSSYVILANGDLGYGAAIVGVDPDHEQKVSTIAATVRTGRYLQTRDTDAIVMGAALARDLKLALGDRVTLLGSALDGTVAAGNLKLVGIFQTGIADLDRQLAEIPLNRFQESFAMPGLANVIVLAGQNLSSVDDALPKLAELTRAKGLVVKDWGALQPAMKQAIHLDFSTSMLWYASLVIVVVFIVLNTLLMSVLERTREFGMLVAIGMRSGLVARMLWLELFFLALLGNILGLLVGGGLSLWLGQRGIAISAMEGLLAQWGLPDKLFPTFSLTSALVGPAVLLLSVALGGLFPMARIERLKPVSAMRGP